MVLYVHVHNVMHVILTGIHIVILVLTNIIIMQRTEELSTESALVRAV